MKTLAFLFSTIVLTGTVFASGVIDIAYSPYTISNPGSYIVVKDLTTPASVNGITINANDVIIDLNGHTLYGPGTTAGSGGIGIASAAGDNITITNGAIRYFNGTGIYLAVAQAHISKVKVVGCSLSGIFVDGGVVENNLVSQNGANGIVCYDNVYSGVIAHNVVSYNSLSAADYPAVWASNNCDVTENIVVNNGSTGIYAIYGNCNITGNTLNNNPYNGIWAGGSNNITGNNVTNTTGGDGILTGSGCNIIGNTVAGSSQYGIIVSYGCRVSDNDSYSNAVSGIYAYQGCTITGNNVYGNSNDGIDATYGSIIRENTIRQNGVIGISADSTCQITDNLIDLDNSVGIRVDGVSNTLLNNSMWTNSTGLWISSSGNFYGGNVLRGNTVSISTVAGNIAGDGSNGGFNNVIVP